MKIYKFLTIFLSVSFLSLLFLIAKSTKSSAQNLPCNSASAQAISRAYILYKGFYTPIIRGKPYFTNEGLNAWKSGEAKRCGNAIAKLLFRYSNGTYSVERQEHIIESYERQQALNDIFGESRPTPFFDLSTYLENQGFIIQGLSIMVEDIAALRRQASKVPDDFVRITQLNEFSKQLILYLEQQNLITPQTIQSLSEAIVADDIMIIQLANIANEITRQQQ